MSDERARFEEESEERIEQDFDLRRQIKGVPRGMAPLVAERSSRRGGRERSERWKGERGAFSLQEADVGNRSVTSSHISRPSPGQIRVPSTPTPRALVDEREISDIR